MIRPKGATFDWNWLSSKSNADCSKSVNCKVGQIKTWRHLNFIKELFFKEEIDFFVLLDPGNEQKKYRRRFQTKSLIGLTSYWVIGFFPLSSSLLLYWLTSEILETISLAESWNELFFEPVSSSSWISSSLDQAWANSRPYNRKASRRASCLIALQVGGFDLVFA